MHAGLLPPPFPAVHWLVAFNLARIGNTNHPFFIAPRHTEQGSRQPLRCQTGRTNYDRSNGGRLLIRTLLIVHKLSGDHTLLVGKHAARSDPVSH
jgi:hypothetical protein